MFGIIRRAKIWLDIEEKEGHIGNLSHQHGITCKLYFYGWCAGIAKHISVRV